MQDVLISVDPHKASNTLAVLDPATKTPIDGARFANTTKGYRALMAFAQRWDNRRWAVEGCHGAGRSLAQRLVAAGEVVLDVPAKLAARVRVFSTGHGRKTDRDDAISVGLAALDGESVAPVAEDGATTSLRLLSDRRDELVALRTQAVCRLHRLLVELTPGGMASELSAKKAASVLVRLRPEGEVAQVRFQLASEHLADIEAIDAKLKTSGAQITALVQATSTSLVDLYGVGPVIAGRILAEVGRRDPIPDQGPLRLIQRNRPDRRILGRPGPSPPVTGREPAAQPRPPHDGGDPAASDGDARTGLLRAQAARGQDPEGGPALPEAPALRHRLLPTRCRQPRQNRGVRITYNRHADAVYVHLTEEELPPGPTASIKAQPPEGIQAFVVLDWKDNRLVGIEVLDASSRLPQDLLDGAETID